MAKQFQLRRGTTAENEAFVGLVGELTYDVQKKEVRVHDGETEGGTILGSGGGGGEVSNIDHITITKNTSNAIQAEATLNKNPSNASAPHVYDWVGTLQEYINQNIKGAHPNWICYITDDYIDDSTDKIHQVSGRNVGDIFYTMRTDSLLNGAVPCDGATYQLTDYIGVDNIESLLTQEKIPYISLSDYNIQLTTNGVVGVIGWDGPGTNNFRVPYLKEIFIEADIASNIGTFMQDGLPNPNFTTNVTGAHTHSRGTMNIKGTFSTRDAGGTWDGSGTWGTKTGAFSSNTGTYSQIQASAAGGWGPMNGVLEFDASKNWTGVTSSEGDHSHSVTAGNPIYGRSNTVQPKAVKYRPMIQLFNAVTDEALLVCKAALSHRVIEYMEPTSSNNYTWYRKYADGWVEQGGLKTNSSGTASITIPVEMSDTNYTVLIGDGVYANANTDIRVRYVQSKTITGFTTSSISSISFSWQVCGKAA